jgi:hypothetical protein
LLGTGGFEPAVGFGTNGLKSLSVVPWLGVIAADADGAAEAADAAAEGAVVGAAVAATDGAVEAPLFEQAAINAGVTIRPAPATIDRVRNRRRPIMVGSVAGATGTSEAIPDPPPAATHRDRRLIRSTLPWVPNARDEPLTLGRTAKR